MTPEKFLNRLIGQHFIITRSRTDLFVLYNLVVWVGDGRPVPHVLLLLAVPRVLLIPPGTGIMVWLYHSRKLLVIAVAADAAVIWPLWLVHLVLTSDNLLLLLLLLMLFMVLFTPQYSVCLVAGKGRRNSQSVNKNIQ